MLDSANQNEAPPSPLGTGKPSVTVQIVGAGAGDASYLTLAAVDAILKADVIYIDDLVDRSIRDLIPTHVEVRYVGKRAGRPSTSQTEIHAHLIAQAKLGRRVVRLKGGDPFIFGRGGEEADALRSAGLNVVIVPGLTAALVAAATTGISLTDRRYASQLTLVTANETDGSIPDLALLAGDRRTLVIYMGGAKGAAIARQLLSSPETAGLPAAIVQDAGRPTQRTTISSVAALENDLSRRDTIKPTLIIVGRVVDEAQQRDAISFADVHFAHG